MSGINKERLDRFAQQCDNVGVDPKPVQELYAAYTDNLMKLGYIKAELEAPPFAIVIFNELERGLMSALDAFRAAFGDWGTCRDFAKIQMDAETRPLFPKELDDFMRNGGGDGLLQSLVAYGLDPNIAKKFIGAIFDAGYSRGKLHE